MFTAFHDLFSTGCLLNSSQSNPCDGCMTTYEAIAAFTHST